MCSIKKIYVRLSGVCLRNGDGGWHPIFPQVLRLRVQKQHRGRASLYHGNTAAAESVNMTPTLVASRTSLPPGGAVVVLGRPGDN